MFSGRSGLSCCLPAFTEWPPATSVCGDATADPVQLVVARTGNFDPATPAAYAAIAGSLPWGTVGVEPKRADNGDYFIWVALGVVAKLRALRGPGESYSDVIVRDGRASSGGIVGARKRRRPRVSVKSGQLPFCERKQSFADERREREMIDNEIHQ
jgi:hypothetical protein